MGGGDGLGERDCRLAVGDADGATGGVPGFLGEELVRELELGFLDAVAGGGLFFVDGFGD